MTKSKKIITLILSVVALTCLVLSTAACGKHQCVFDQENTEVQYRKSAATCTSPAVYYYSCECGECGTETFTKGEAKGHEYELSVIGDYETEFMAGDVFDDSLITVTKTCLNCDDSSIVTDYEVSPAGELSPSDTEVKIIVGDLYYFIPVTVSSASVTDVKLEVVDNSKVIYSLIGICGENFTKDDLYFDLSMTSNWITVVDKDDVTFSSEKVDGKTVFTLSADVTNIHPNGSYCFPHLHVDGSKTDVTSVTEDWAQGVTLGDSRYDIVHNNDLEKSPFAMPAVRRVYTKEITEDQTADGANSYFSADSVRLEADDDNVYFVVEGSYKNHTLDSLYASLILQIRTGSKNHRTLQDQGFITLDEANNKYTAKIVITGLKQTGETPYYTRFHQSGYEFVQESKGGRRDFNFLSTEAVDKNAVTLGDYTYTLIYEVGGSEASVAWGTVGITVE